MLVAALGSITCEKVPLTDIDAAFSLADATWFAEEQTLFIFYRVKAQQGIGPESLIEVSYRTDVELPWTRVQELPPPVHTHLPVDCGVDARCGSTSVMLTRAPSEVRVRLRYHRDGEMNLPVVANLNVIAAGPPDTNRSLVVYGVFDADNARVQWRARHQFPTLRNEEVQALGLRRAFRITGPSFGGVRSSFFGNAYGYGFANACPANATALDWPAIETSSRAVFDPHELPAAAANASGICADSWVTDAKGEFRAVAVARKNPAVRPAFPVLHSPIRRNTPIATLLRPCQRTISEPHRLMQMQRLLLVEAPEICVDNWREPGFADQLAADLRARIDQKRIEGNDMVVTIALHHDDATGGLAAAVENALALVVVVERDKSSPRVTGAFVYDSLPYTIVRPDLQQMVLWCPAFEPAESEGGASTAAQHACPLLPDFPDLKLGPLRVSTLPILPTRAQYLSFVRRYSEAQAGRMRDLIFLAPVRTPLSDNVPAGPTATATFFNNEILTAAPTDAFSFCSFGDPLASAVVFRSAMTPLPQPIAALPELHRGVPQASYSLGLLWDFPFLLRLQYEVGIAGAASAFSLTVPFGLAAPTHEYFGAELWLRSEFPLSSTLLQCTAFCDHPTFDSAGVYNVTSGFRTTYPNQCYRPRFPLESDGGFPRDP